MKNTSLLTIRQLRVQITTQNGIIQPIEGLNLTLDLGEIFALVGESGCGKSMTALSINRLLPENAALCKGSEIFLGDIPLHQLSEKVMCTIRGKKIAMVFQDPTLALNPVLTIGEQLRERLKHNSRKEMINLLERVRIPNPDACLTQYPHQLSGGMKQRIVIAIALAQSPDLLIADEPTTALDVTTQKEILQLLKDLNKQMNMGILLITHDLAIVGQMADTVAVMYAGHIIEQSLQKEFMQSPKHPYTKQLFAALPQKNRRNQKLITIPGQVPILNRNFSLCRFRDRCRFAFSACEILKPNWIVNNYGHCVRCHWYDTGIVELVPTLDGKQEIRLENAHQQTEMNEEFGEELNSDPPVLKVDNLKVYYPIRKGLFKRTVGVVKAVDDLSFQIKAGSTLAIVGESGCGKTTLAKAILRLVPTTGGKIEFLSKSVLTLSGRKLKWFRNHLQIIFQDPHSSMDPRMMVGDIIEEGMIALKIGTDVKERQDRINVLLEQVGLHSWLKSRYPHELSGGQKQRVAIARALAVGAQLIICDEPTSALDVSVQAQILNLLKSLQNDLSISYLFITHNISIVNYIADYVAVMYSGKIVEYGAVDTVLKRPQHPYTQKLLHSVP